MADSSVSVQVPPKREVAERQVAAAVDGVAVRAGQSTRRAGSARRARARGRSPASPGWSGRRCATGCESPPRPLRAGLRQQRADRPARSCRSRPRRSARSGRGPWRRSGTRPASTGCSRRSRWRGRCPATTGYLMPFCLIAAATLPASCSNENSGECTPTMVRPSLRYGLVPRHQVRQRADAVDAGVGPEVDQHDAPAQRGERERLGVEPLLRAREVRRRAVVAAAAPRGSRACRPPRRGRSATAGAAWPAASETAFEVSSDFVGLTTAAGRWLAIAVWKRTSSWNAIATAVSDHHRAERALQRRPAARAADPVGDRARPASASTSSTTARAERVGQADGDGPPGRRADGDHRGEDRARARRVDEAERARRRGCPDQKPLPAAARPEARQPAERRLQPVAELRARRWRRRTAAARRSRCRASPSRPARRRPRRWPGRRSSR